MRTAIAHPVGGPSASGGAGYPLGPFVRQPLRPSLKLALASGLAWEVSRWLGAERPVFAVLAVVVTMQSSAYGSLTKGLERLVGVFAGVALGVAALHVTGLSTSSLTVLMLVTALSGGVLSFGGGFNSQVSVSALLLVASGGGVAYGVARAWETAVGGALGVLVTALVWPPDPLRRMAQQLDLARLRLAADVVATADALGGQAEAAGRLLRRVRQHAAHAEIAVAELSEAEQAVRWFPARWPGNEERDVLAGRLRAVASLYRHLHALSHHVLQARRAGCGQGQGCLREAAGSLAAACGAIGAAPSHADRRSARAWLAAADGAVARYWSEARHQAKLSAPVAAEFQHLLADMRVALAGAADGEPTRDEDRTQPPLTE